MNLPRTMMETKGILVSEEKMVNLNLKMTGSINNHYHSVHLKEMTGKALKEIE